MTNIAICFCGFNRESLLTINLKNIFEKYYFYNSNIKLYILSYLDSFSENNDNKIDIEKQRIFLKMELIMFF